MTMFSDLVNQRLAALDLGLVFGERVCLEQVSKDLRGRFRPEQREEQPCVQPDCLTLKLATTLDAEAITNPPCDRVSTLDGRLHAKLVFTFENNEQGRGLCLGEVQWQSASGLVLRGTMSGIVNAGTHRPPTTKCEPCDQRGRITGMLEAVVGDGPQRDCTLLASYALTFDFGAAGMDTTFAGALEGLFICPCSSPA